MRSLGFWCSAALLVFASGCGIERGAPTGPVVFAGPMELPLHEDITPKSRVVARVHHGDKLSILQQRRRLYKLRTEQGAEGWTDERNLMSVDQMSALAHLEKEAQRLPNQGVATTFETLNVHTEAQRFSPSFAQIRQGEKFDVIAHQTTERKEPARRVLVKPQPKTDTGKGRKRGDRRKSLPLPPPPTPKLPPNWVELSQQRQPPEAPPDPDEEDKEPLPTDDWTLVRTPAGVSGWVLTSRIYLAIPDEVAQYAEGHRITTYFSLGKIHDAELNADKDIWLWTTIHSGQHPFDFDSFRVFTWNPRRHRYETAYIQRTVEGYLPVLVKKDEGQMTFSVCFGSEGEPPLRKRYAMLDRQVRGLEAQECTREAMLTAAPAPKSVNPGVALAAEPETNSFKDRLKQRADAMKKKLFGK